MRVQITLLLACSRAHALWVQQAAIAGGSAARRSDWNHNVVGNSPGDLDEFLFETEMAHGARRMHRRTSQLSFDRKDWEQPVDPNDRVDELDLIESLLSLAVYVSSYIVQQAVSA